MLVMKAAPVTARLEMDRRTSSLKAWLLCLGLELFFFHLGDLSFLWCSCIQSQAA